jgi:hypothetical protein
MKTVSILVACSIILASCSSNPKQGQAQNQTSMLSDTTTTKTSSDTTIDKEGGIPIFYNMYLSVEMSSLFKSIGASYNEKMLNSPDNVSRYNSSVDKALNLGVYAVDLSYAKYFDEINQAGKYLKSMHQMVTELGIPDDKFMISLKRVENNVANKDSLIRIANELYKATEQHLKESERESAAAFIIAGGWTEALHIATNLASKTDDKELIERIEEQRHSLDNLISLLKKYEKETAVKEFLSKLFDLKTSFDKFASIQHNAEEKLIKEIGLKISSLRKDIVN